MKHNLQDIKVVRYIGIVLLVLILALVSSRSASATPPPDDPIGNTQESQDAISRYLVAQNNPVLSEEEKIKAAIDAYFTLRYEGQKSLVMQDFSALLEDDTLDWVKMEQDKREIELYIATLFDLRYEKYAFTLDYDSIEIKDNEAVVRLRESHTVVFSALAPDESKLFNLPHTMTLHYNTGAWVICQDEYVDELSNQLKTMSVEQIKKVVDENFKSEQKTFEPPVEVEPLSSTSYPYNRAAAVNYANIHSSNYNTNWYHSYAADCTNYVSQALYAGIWKAPIDERGMSADRNEFVDWYFDFNTPKGVDNGSGSWPWIRTQEQRDFLTTNYTGLGPYGYETPMLCSVSVGDIVQLKNANPDPAEWDHEGIIVWKSPTGSCSSLSSYWVNAHTTDRYHYPLSNWSSYPMRYIIISGYRLDTTGTQSFSDVPKNQWYWQDVERLYDAGFTAGCAQNPLRYCPNDNVKRSEMAVFLLRGIYGSSYTPPPATGTVFADVSLGHWAAAWIEKLYSIGITGGCATNPLRYCPEDSVTHAQMAVFLLRSYHYPDSYTPSSAGTTTHFSDVPTSHWAAKWIKQLAFEGFSYGAYNCSPGNYCPDQAITRAEMASMLVRTFINWP